jgi:hypothetical protein
MSNPAYCPLYTASRRGADMSATDHDWTKPAALSIPEEGYFRARAEARQ